MTTKKTPTKQNKREAKQVEKQKAKKEVAKKSVSKGKCPEPASDPPIAPLGFRPFAGFNLKSPFYHLRDTPSTVTNFEYS